MLVERRPNANVDETLWVKKIASALLYGVVSFAITLVNRIVLTVYKFPSYQVLGLGQMLTSIIVLQTAMNFRIIHIPPLDRQVPRHIFPLPIFYLGHLFTGLEGTKELNLPMFTALRRVSILMTMFAERLVLGIRDPWPLQLSVYVMVVGALIATADDLAFSLPGYTMIFLNDGFTAAWGVYMKKKLDEKVLARDGLIYYNALFMIFPAAAVAWWSGDMHRCVLYKFWRDLFFQAQFFFACVMGILLTYSVFLCTQYNSPLTTAVIGCLKNILLTYMGVILGGDLYSYIYFIGMHISIVAFLFYTYKKFINISTPVNNVCNT